MLLIDGLTLSHLVKELQGELMNKKVGKIYQTTPSELSLAFGRTTLNFLATPNLACCYLTKKSSTGMNPPLGFILSLRKYLQNSQLVQIKQSGLDRVVFFEFKKLNELGTLETTRLYFEIVGRQSNLILTDEHNKIIDLLKKVSLDTGRKSSQRTLLIGANYCLPDSGDKKNPFDITKDNFLELGDVSYGNFQGLGRQHQIGSYEDLQRVINKKPNPTLIFKNDAYYGGIFMESTEKDTPYGVEALETISILIESYLEKTNLYQEFSNLQRRLGKELKRALKKRKKILENIEEELTKASSYERQKELGDLLAANLYQVKKGMDKIEIWDFYSEKMIELDLDINKYPKENLDNYYKAYNKGKRGLAYNEARQKQISEELEYLSEIKSFFEAAKELEELYSIEKELVTAGFIKPPKAKNPKLKKKATKAKIRMIEIEGRRFYYGKTNLENDYLTTKYAKRENHWFHTKDLPAGHVILDKVEALNGDDIRLGAELAAYLTKVEMGESVTVDYTRVKHLKKPKGSKPGFVIYHVFSSITAKKPQMLPATKVEKP